MIKTIILVRHGETEKDKNNPNRKITLNGKSQIKQTALEIQKLISGNGIIVTTKTKRTRMSSKIIKNILDLKIKQTQISLRVDNFDLIEKKYKNEKNIVFKYFEDFKKNNLNPKISSPIEIAGRFLRIIGGLEKDFIIFVGHGGALESFALFQNAYKPIVPTTKDLGYGKFIVLKSN